MFASQSPATPEQEETLQDLLNALTKPPKWMVGTATVTGVASVNESSSPNENATWMAGGMRNHGNHNANTTIADTWPLTGVKDVVTISSVSPEEEVIGIETNFWYKYGISITIAVLVLVVALVLIIQCRMVYLKTVRRRRLVDFVNSGNVNRSNKARDEIFESFHRQATASLSGSRLQPAPAHEEIPMRHLRETQSANRWSTSMRGRGPEPLARVYPLHFDPVWDKNGNITDPYPCSNRRLWNTTAGLYPIRVHRSVLSEPAIARPTSRRYSSRNRIRKIPVMRGDTRFPKYNLSGKRIVTSPESNASLRMRNSEIRRHTVAYGEPNVSTLLMELNSPTPKLVVPTNSPITHYTDSGENTPPHGPGLDSDFGASAGIPHFTVSPDNSMNVTGDTASGRDTTYEWDTYDPAYMNRTVSYVDGAYFPVLHRRQYWV